MSSETLSQLARFPQKTVRKRLIENPSLDRETVEFLYDWFVSEGEKVLSRSVFSKQHPSKWWSLFRNVCPKMTSAQCFDSMRSQFILFARTLDDKELGDYYGDLNTLLAPFLDEDTLRNLAVSIAKALLPYVKMFNTVNTPGQHSTFLEGIQPQTERVKVLVQLMHSLHSGLSFSENLVNDLTVNSGLLTGQALPNAGLVLNDSQVLSFLDRGSPWLERLAANSVGSCGIWSDETVNAVAQRDPVGFIKAPAFQPCSERLTNETFGLLLKKLPKDVIAQGDTRVVASIAQRLPYLDAELSAVLALRLPPVALVDLLNTGVAPSCSPAQIIDLLARDLYCLEDRASAAVDDSDGVWISPRYQVRGSQRPVLAGVVGVLREKNPDVVSGTPGALWMLELLDLAARVTTASASAPNAPCDDKRDLYVYAVYYWLNKHLGDSPTGWLAALDLLPKWSGTVRELAVTVKESLQ